MATMAITTIISVSVKPVARFMAANLLEQGGGQRGTASHDCGEPTDGRWGVIGGGRDCTNPGKPGAPARSGGGGGGAARATGQADAELLDPRPARIRIERI